MRLFATCLLSLGLVVSPAMADGTPDKDSADAAKKTASEKASDAAKKVKPDSTTTFETELQKLREEVAQQRAELNRERQKVQALEQRLGMTEAAAPAAETPGTPAAPASAAGGALATPALRSGAAQERPKESPLSFRIGGADFTPGGFVDFENVFRSTNTGGPTATSFGAIPFSNTVQGHLTEFRTTGQYSRFNLTTNAKFGGNNVTGYIEFDFNGNDAANVFVSSNGHTDRLRLYWMNWKRGKWEFLGGQAWGLLTPNRRGVGTGNADLALPYNEDANIQVGINYTRAGTFRAIFHPNEKWAWGIGIENPDQFVGAGEVIFPFAFNAALGPQFDAANQTTTPNVGPDINTKLAFDTDYHGGKHFHFEVGGTTNTVKITNVPVGGTTFVSHSKLGGGVQTAFNVDLYKDSQGRSFRVLANGLWGNGVGRYIIGLGPQAVVRPIQTGPTTFDIEPSLVRSGNALVGVEFQPQAKTQFGAYYGGAYFRRNAFPDITSPLVIKPIIGFGGATASAATNAASNRAIQEVTFDWTQTLYRNPQHGALLLISQTSYVTRAPWFVPKDAVTGALLAPKNAHLVMQYLSLRYVLP